MFPVCCCALPKRSQCDTLVEILVAITFFLKPVFPVSALLNSLLYSCTLFSVMEALDLENVEKTATNHSLVVREPIFLFVKRAALMGSS
jgi:hypothetical protein